MHYLRTRIGTAVDHVERSLLKVLAPMKTLRPMVEGRSCVLGICSSESMTSHAQRAIFLGKDFVVLLTVSVAQMKRTVYQPQAFFCETFEKAY